MTARLAPAGGAVVHAMHYLGPEEHADVAELEAFVDRAVPGWRDHAVHRRFLPALHAASAVALAERPRPGVALRPGIWAAGDWVGDEGLIAEASAASAAQAAADIAATLGRARAAS
jgi:phytoene dehydrogenase-like protein